jgi:hypothetical protein
MRFRGGLLVTPERQFVMPGSETRQRNLAITIRLSETEHRMLHGRAHMSGLSMGGYLRKAALGKAGPRSKRPPAAERDELRRLKGELGRVGNNLNQIAHALNTGTAPAPGELETALAELAAVHESVRRALGGGREEDEPPPRDGGAHGD